MTSILFVGGGSAGHIAPAMAIAEALKENLPELTLSFVCSTRPEDREYLERHGYTAIPIDAPRFSSTFIGKFWRAYRAAHTLLRERNPRLVFSKGGYVSVPVCLAAHRLGIPIILHESDVVGGLANRLVAHWARWILRGFPQGHTDARTIVTGNPIATSITTGSRERGLGITGLSGRKPILLVMGGSQGSQALNEAVVRTLPELLAHCDIIHLTGKGKETATGTSTGHWQATFAFEELPHLYAAADLALSRAGASTIAELAANGIPAILVPLRGVAQDHQERNARLAEASGGCRVLEQHRLSSRLLPTVRALLTPERRKIMGTAIRTLHHPEAARQIAELIARSLA